MPLNRSTNGVHYTFYTEAEAGNIGKLYKAEKALFAGDYDNAQSIISNIAPDNAIENNYKTFYTAYLHMKQGALNATDTTVIARLVHGCAPRDGFVVYQARALYRLLYKDFQTYFDECENNSKKIISIKQSQEDREPFFNLYPNPNNGDMTFTYLLQNNEVGQMLIYDIAGKEIANYHLDNRQTALYINESSLQNGVYFYAIIVNNKFIHNGKVIIIK